MKAVEVRSLSLTFLVTQTLTSASCCTIRSRLRTPLLAGASSGESGTLAPDTRNPS